MQLQSTGQQRPSAWATLHEQKIQPLSLIISSPWKTKTKKPILNLPQPFTNFT